MVYPVLDKKFLHNFGNYQAEEKTVNKF